MTRDPTTFVWSRYSAIRAWVFLWALLTGFAVAQVPPEKTLKSASPKPIECPPAGLSTPPISPHPSGHHAVTLTWKADASSKNRITNAVGYCLYRRQKPGTPKELSDCKDCELVSPIAVVGTGCVDDSVEDGVTYYYVVSAANEFSHFSDSSNEAPAEIPRTEPAKPGAISSYPLCRQRERGRTEH